MPASRKPLRRSAHESHSTAGETVAVRVVATVREAVVDAQVDSALDDLRLREVDERGVDVKSLRALDGGLRRQIGHLLERTRCTRADSRDSRCSRVR